MEMSVDNVKQLENEAREDPSGYKLKVILLGLLGYAYIFGVIALFLCVIAGVVWAIIYSPVRPGVLFLVLAKKLLFPFLILFVMVMRALWVRFDKPQGFELDKNKAPLLFEELEKIRKAINAPKIHKVLLDTSFNAAITSHPVFGVFGWYRHYLILGFPYMACMSEEEYRSVLAHEYGHLARAHGKSGAWIYRVRVTWYRLMEHFENNDRFGSFVFSKFFNWYAPVFNAYSLPYARAKEEDADRFSVYFAGAAATARSFLKPAAAGNYLNEKLWPEVYKAAEASSEPVIKPYERMISAFSGISPEEAGKWIDKEMQAETGSFDTHPALKERFKKLKQEVKAPDFRVKSSAEHFFGPGLKNITAMLDDSWKQRVAGWWQERHAYCVSAKAKLEVLLRKAPGFTAAEALETGRLVEEFDGEKEAFAYYKKAYELNRNHAEANFALGRILLNNDKEQGIDYIRTAMDLDADATLDGCEKIIGYLENKGRKDEARAYYEIGESRAALERLARQERSVTTKDVYEPHGIPYIELGPVLSHFRSFPEVKEVMAVRKAVQYLPERPHIVFGFTRKLGGLRLEGSNDDLAVKIMEGLKTGYSFTIIPLHGASGKYLRKKLKKVPDALIYKK